MKVQGELGEEYGTYFALLNLSAILNIALDFGIGNFNNRKIAANPGRYSNYFQNISIIRLFLALVYTVLLQLVGIALGYDNQELYLLFILGICQVFLSSLLYVRSNFTAFGKFKLDSLFSVLDRLLMIGGVVYLMYYSSGVDVNIENFIFVQFYGYGISLILGVTALVFIEKTPYPKLNKRFAKVLIQKSAPYALIVVLMAAYHYSDSIMIERMLEDGKYQNALYAQSFRVLMALNNYAYLFAVLLLPMFSKMLSNKESVQSLIGVSSSLLIFGVSAISILLFYFAKDVITACYGDFGNASVFINDKLNFTGVLNTQEIIDSVEIFTILILGIIPMSVNYCFGTLITASGNMKLLNKVAFISLVLNVILNFILIPKFGALGAALSSISTQTVSGIVQVLFAINMFKLKIDCKLLIRFVLGILVLVFGLQFNAHFDLVLRLLYLSLLGFFSLFISVNFTGIIKMAKDLKHR